MKHFAIRLYQKFKSIINYFFFSALSTVVDVAIVWILYNRLELNLAFSNSVGVVTGFIISFVLSLKVVFDAKFGLPEFLVYFLTFLGGLVLANFLITSTNSFLEPLLPKWMAFAMSKGVSIVVPFFGMYFIRKYAYAWLNKRRQGNE